MASKLFQRSRVSSTSLRRGAAFCCATSMLVCSGCLFQKTRHVAFTPPPPHPPAKAEPAPVLPAPPLLTIDLSSLFPPDLPVTLPDLPEPPKPQPRPRPPVAAGPKAPSTLPDQPAPPKLGPLFTAEQTREYVKDLEDSLERVKRALTTLGRKRLNAEQVVTVERIRTFQKQAEQARQEDLVTAVNLARRADLLAQDLLGRLP
jgi:hypothetical protein